MGKDRRKSKKCISITMIMFSLFVMLSCGNKYDYIGDFQGGLALVHSVKTNKYGAIDKKKKEVIPCIYDTILLNNNSPIVMLNGKYGVVSISGTEKIPCRYDSISFDGKFYIVKLGNKYGIFSESKEIIQTKYDAFRFSEGKITAELDGEIYKFDEDGNFLPDMLYIDIYRKEDGTYPTYAECLADRLLGSGVVDEVYFIDVDSKERLEYKEIIIDGNAVVNVQVVRFMLDAIFGDEKPPEIHFIFKEGKSKKWVVNSRRQYQYTLKDNVLKIKEYADNDE